MQMESEAPASPRVHTESNPAAGSGSLFSSPQKLSVVLCLLLVLATLAVYNPISHNAFINVDDNGYLTENNHVQSGLSLATLRWSITTFACENWHPLTWLSHALDWQLFGKNAAGHHYMSVLIHCLNAVLLFLLLQNATGFTWRSAIVAALFAVHPVNVESVAWASERKNVLSMTFFLLALMAYGWYAQRPSVRRYGAVALLFALALMAKPQVITLPFVLLLWDYWPLRRLNFSKSDESFSRYAPASMQWLVIEKIPLLFLAAGDALLTMHAQQNAVHNGWTHYAFPSRLANALVAYARYIAHAVWPLQLSPTYPHLGNAIPVWQILASSALLLLVTGFAVMSQKRHLLVGWLWFLGILVPMVGIVQVGDQAMADRYAYIPFIGLFWMATWTIAEIGQEWQVPSSWLAAPACMAIVGLAVITPRQVSYWHDSETLWRYALSVNDRDFIAHSYLAQVLTKEGKHEEAMVQYSEAEQIHAYPLTQVVYFADYQLRHNHLEGAIADANRVIAGTTDRDARQMAFRDLGIANTQLGKADEAKQDFQQALQLDSRDPYSLIGMGLLAYRAADFPSAVDYFSRVVAVDPSDFDYLVLANALRQSGRLVEANDAYAHAQSASSNWTAAQEKAHWFLSN